MDHHAHKPASTRLDKLAILISGLCLAHCLAIPLALLAAPVLGATLFGTTSLFHWIMLGVALPVSGAALWRGYRHHGLRHTLVIGGVGLLLLMVAVSHLIAASLEVPLTIVGVLILLAAHVMNLRHAAHCHPAT